MIKKTSLYNLHQKNGAKLVEFAGYHMPIQYKDGIIQEHKFTRSNCGIFDVSHMGQLFINGQENLTNDLENIFPVDLKNLNINQSKYSFLMNDNAGIHDDLIITKNNNITTDQGPKRGSGVNNKLSKKFISFRLNMEQGPKMQRKEKNK